MLNVDKVKGIQALITELGYECCIAGSSVYLNKGTASDIDVYINWHNKPQRLIADDLLDQLTMEGEYTIVSKTEQNEYSKGVSWIKQVVYLLDEDKTIYNLMFTDYGSTLAYQGYAHWVISTFDYGITQIAWDGKSLVKTLAYETDKKNKTSTLLHVWSLYHMTVMDTRVQKMQARFPRNTVRFSDAWYHPEPITKRKPTKFVVGARLDTPFLQQVREARERINRFQRHR